MKIVAKKPIIIAIDGYSACGKSTMAKALADVLGYTFIDSGAMYRAITWFLIQNKIAYTEEAILQKILPQLNLSFKTHSAEKAIFSNQTLLNGEDITEAIRQPWVNEKVSEIATLEQVRNFCVATQQKMGEQKAIVMDGRDIGTTVFPNAELKVFVEAALSIRVQRRWDEIKELSSNIDIETIEKNLVERDYIDTHRAISPLRKAADAWVLDNSFLSKQEQLAILTNRALEKINAH